MKKIAGFAALVLVGLAGLAVTPLLASGTGNYPPPTTTTYTTTETETTTTTVTETEPQDFCDTLEGVQAEDEDCPPPVVDVCPNLDGVQEDPPLGYGIVDGECVELDITPFCAPPLVLNEAGQCVSPPPAAPRCPPGTGPYGGKDTDESDPYHNQECCPDVNPINERCDDQEAIWTQLHARPRATAFVTKARALWVR